MSIGEQLDELKKRILTRAAEDFVAAGYTCNIRSDGSIDLTLNENTHELSAPLTFFDSNGQRI